MAVTKDDDQDDDATMDISRFVVPGAFSVPVSNSLLELDTVTPDLPVVDSSLAHRGSVISRGCSTSYEPT